MFRATCHLWISGSVERAAFEPLIDDILMMQPNTFEDIFPSDLDEVLEALNDDAPLVFEYVANGSVPSFVDTLAQLGLTCIWACKADAGIPARASIYHDRRPPAHFACDVDEQILFVSARDLTLPSYHPQIYIDAQALWDGMEGMQVIG